MNYTLKRFVPELIRSYSKQSSQKLNRFLKLYGNRPIYKIQVFRAPLLDLNKKILDLTTIKQLPYDEVYHLGVFINDQYIVEKVENVSAYRDSRFLGKKPNVEVMNVPLNNKKLTLEDLLENTRRRMGDSKYYKYDPYNNNCQDFIRNLLIANKLDTPELLKFVGQQAVEVLKATGPLSYVLGPKVSDNIELYSGAKNILGFGKKRLWKY